MSFTAKEVKTALRPRVSKPSALSHRAIAPYDSPRARRRKASATASPSPGTTTGAAPGLGVM